LDWRQGARTAQFHPSLRRNVLGKYGTLFSEPMTLRECFQSQHDTIREICRAQADEIYLGKEPNALIHDAIRDLVEDDYIPNLILGGELPEQHTNIQGYVGIRYLIHVDKDPQGLIWKLPDQFEENGLSEYAELEKTAGLPADATKLDQTQHFLELKYFFPQEVWNTQRQRQGWLKALVDKDVGWLKAVVEDFHMAFQENARTVTTLIHIELHDKWQSAMDVAGEVGTAPLPVENINEHGAVRKTVHYSAHKNYLFGRQEGICNGCRGRFCFEQMTVDHIVPQSKDGGHEAANLQLLCQPCNNLKADDSHEDLLARLAAQGPKNAACCGC